MKIISWNVNSIRARMENFLEVVKEYNPDIFLLQETRVADASFPMEYFDDLGYNIQIKGQKARSGVAIFSKHIIEEVKSDFCEEARYIEAFTGGIFIASVYVPNGQEVDTDQYFYKLDFLRDLKNKMLEFKDETFIIGGDFNVAPYPKDVYISNFDGVAATERERNMISDIRDAGFSDVLENEGYTWWSYRQRDFAKDHGYRIDHFYLSHKAKKLMKRAGVLRDTRQMQRPSDHAAIFCEL